MSMAKSVLIIAHEFPPLNRGGVHRILRFANYLSQHELEPTIVTVEEDAYQAEHLDDSLLAGVSIDIVRTPIEPQYAEDNYYLSLVDTIGKRWWPHLEKRLAQLIEEKQPVAILVTAPPFSMVELSRKIGKQYQVPLILDMRDAWSNWNIVPFPSKLHYLLTKRLEGKAIEAADKVLVTSQQTRADLVQTHGAHLEQKLVLVTNAYEGKVTPISPVSADAKLKIGYVGSFYYNPVSQRLLDSPWWNKKPYQIFQYTPRKENWLYRSPYFIFKSFRALLDQFPELQDRFQLVFAGKKPVWFDDMVNEFELSGHLKHVGLLSKEESLQFQQSCDALLLTSSKVLNGRDYSIAGKTFEYFISGKPILGFVKEGAQKDILKESGMALLLDPDDSTTAAQQLHQWISGDVTLTPDYSALRQYSAEATSLALSQIINAL